MTRISALRPTRHRVSIAGAMLSIAIAVLLSLLPSPPAHGGQVMESAFGAATPEQCLTVSAREAELRRALPSRPNDQSLLLPAIARPIVCTEGHAAIAYPRQAPARAPPHWPQTGLSRAPPIA